MKGLTPKEKAIEIVRRVFNEQDVDDRAKQICISTTRIALFLVDEIIKAIPDEDEQFIADAVKYWQEVKKEIEKIDKL